MYLKGPGQTLNLSASAGVVTLTNTGSVACLPAIRAKSTDGSMRVSLDRVDVSMAAATPDGVTPTALVEPSQSVTFNVVGHGTIEAAWNPQEPANSSPRATLTIGVK